jgi:hypothetical protein
VSATVWLAARTLDTPSIGGNFWMYLNWALGLRACGCRVVWLEAVRPETPPTVLAERFQALQRRLHFYEIDGAISLCPWSEQGTIPPAPDGAVPLEAAREADLLLDLAYLTPSVVQRFRRSALLDIDPGLVQVWVSRGELRLAGYSHYFTLGETVGAPNALFPDCGLPWQYTPPCVALDWWPLLPAPPEAPFTAVSSWFMGDWVADENGGYPNDKRTGFLPLVELPRRTRQPLELAICLGGLEEERRLLEQHGWRVRESQEASGTPEDYRRYLQTSRGEFGWTKPSCIRLQNAWISPDRTVCYLASGRPAVVQHTGPSRFLPDASGIFRYRSLAEAAQYLDAVAADYDRQSRLARKLAEEYFDAGKVVSRLLERSLN